MVSDDELRKMDINAAQGKIQDILDQLDALKGNSEVGNYAAGEYVDEAIDSLEAALVDLEDARED